MKGKIIVAAVLAVALVGTLVLGSDIIASYLESSSYVTRVYGADTFVGDSGPAIKAFINKIEAAGGGYFATDFTPYVSVTLAQGEGTYYMGPDFTIKGTINATTDLTNLPIRIHVGYADLGVSCECSTEFENYTKAGKFSWYGNYSEGREIRSILQVNNDTIDLGTSYESNVIFSFNLDSGTIDGVGDVVSFPGMNNETVPPELVQILNFSGQWVGGDWEIVFSKLLAMTGDSGSASVLFEGSVWLTGNYTVTVEGVSKNGTTNLSKIVSFGRIDVAFQGGRISTLDFRFDRIDIALCVRPEE